MTKQRIVVKIGSSSLTNHNGGLSEEKLCEHVLALAKLKKAGHEVILISSGAVAAGFTHLNYPTRPVTLAGKQAAAAVGQGLLMQGYAEKFREHDIIVAQLLLTRENFANQHQYHNVYSTLTELLKRGVIPIINENDSVAVDELTFGDNDMLSSLVSGLIHANTLIILTDVNGLYDDNPAKNPDAKKYSYLAEITDDLLEAAGGAGSKVGTGGMRSKVEAAKTALSLGVKVFIGTGQGEEKLLDILHGKGDGTYIGDSEHTLVKNKKQWIGLHSDSKGSVTIDAGAELAMIEHGKSLLPAGIIETNGDFSVGDVVSVTNEGGKLIGKGIINFSHGELQRIKGLSSNEAMKLTKTEKPEAIHRDNWVMINKEMIINE